MKKKDKIKNKEANLEFDKVDKIVTIFIDKSYRISEELSSIEDDLRNQGYIVNIYLYISDNVYDSTKFSIDKDQFSTIIENSDILYIYNDEYTKGYSDYEKELLHCALEKHKEIIFYSNYIKRYKGNSVAIIGSFKYIELMESIARFMALNGIIPLMPVSARRKRSYINFSELTKDQIENIHDAEDSLIKLANYVLVVNKNGYIGNDTQREIEYAESINKQIKYYDPLILNKE